MASLIEDFICTLNKEASEYKELLEISTQKTPIIVKGDIKALAGITEKEQVIVDRISLLDKHRVEVLGDMANVLNREVQVLKVPKIMEILQRQPKEREALGKVYEELKTTLAELKNVNERNRSLISLSLDMVQFDLNLLQASKRGPETGDYNKRGTYSSQPGYGGSSRFDSKS